MELQAMAIPSNRFTIKDSVFVAEISDFGPGFRFSRIYDDACDVGLTVVSMKTGSMTNFVIYQEHRDEENELTHWTLKPTREAIRKNPGLTNVRMEIFND